MAQEKKQIGRKEASLLLDEIYEKAIDGIPQISKPIEEVANDYLLKNGSPSRAAKSLIKYQIAKCGTSGFLSGLGGVVTMPITIPANIGSVVYVQLRMIAAIATLGGYDVSTDQVQTMAYICLTGTAASDILKQTGIDIGTKMTKAAISKIPGKVLTSINQKVGFKLFTKAGEKGAINLVKLVPVAGGVIGGAMDIATTKIIADNAYRLFIKKEALTKDKIKHSKTQKRKDYIDVTFTEEPSNKLPKVVAFYGHKNGPWKCFSNHYPSDFVVDGIQYNCAEQYMMREKALCFGRNDLVEKIMKETDPVEMKRMCRKESLPEFKADKWNPIKYEKVKVGVKAKFQQNDELKKILLDTGDSLICEASPRDKEWGIGMGSNNPLIQDPKNWKGDNLLGEMLMEIRNELREEE